MEELNIKEIVLELKATRNVISQCYERNPFKELGDTIISLDNAIFTLSVVELKKPKKEKKKKEENSEIEE
jgi:hypothetical protein